MPKRDALGRITHLTVGEKNLSNGHSVCQDCGKDMPRAWDVICKKCHGAFCYECALLDRVGDIRGGGYWYCRDDAPKTARYVPAG